MFKRIAMARPRTKNLKGALGIAAFVLLAVPASAQLRVLISTNQMNQSEAAQSWRLKADGVWFLGYNSPDISYGQWQSVFANIGTNELVSEDAGISSNYLFNAQLTPRIMLRSSRGGYLSAHGGLNAPLVANIDADARTDPQIFKLYFSPPTTIVPQRPALTDLPQNGAELCFATYDGKWISATGGGGSTLFPKNGDASYWERFRLMRKVLGDSWLRPGDQVSLQTWNGFFTGGNYANLDPNDALALKATGSALMDSETFTLSYPCEFVTSRQIGNITHAMVYTEWADTQPIARNWTLNNDEINEVARRTGAPNVVVLTRTYEDISELPGVLPTHRQQIDGILSNPNLKGVVFEMEAGGDLAAGKILQAVDAVRSKGKDVFFLLPPKASSTNYTNDIRKTFAQIKGTKWYSSIQIVLAAYGRPANHVKFVGGANTVEGALKWLKANR